MIIETRRFFATSTQLLPPSGAWPLAAVAMLVIFPVAAPALADTVVPGNGTPVIVPDVPSIGANLDFIAGTGDPAVLQLLTGGIYSGEWSINNVPAIFDLNGGSLVIAPSVGTGTATGDANVGVVNGTLQLGTNSFLTGFGTSGAGGTLSAIQGGRLVVDDDRWLSNMVRLQLGGAWTSGSAATLSYSGASSITSAAGVSVEGGTASAIALSGAGSLTLTGDISGTGDLVVTTAGGSGTVNLAFSFGSFDGKTVIDNAAASINTQNSIGTQGLTINSGTVTAGTALTLGAGQAFDLGGTSTLTGGGPGLTAFTVNGGMTGTGDITLTGINMTVGGTTSTYTGGITLAGAAGSESTVTTTNAAWLSSLGSLTMANNTSLTYSGADAANYAGAIVTGTSAGDRALVFTSGAGNGNLTLSGTVSGTGDLVIGAASGSTATTTLAFALGTLAGRTVIEDANVAINTQASIGAAGLSLNGATVTLGTGITLGAGQDLAVSRASTLTGAAGGANKAFTVDSAMSGGGNLSLDRINMRVTGATSAYTGAVTLAGTSALTTGNQQWLTNVASLTLGNETSLIYDGIVAGNYSGPLNATGASATIATSGATAADFTVDGTVTATGNLVISALDGSTATTVLAFDNASSIAGSTVIDGAKARINTSDSVGATGLTLTDGDLTLGTALTLGAGQALAVNGTSSVSGTGGANTAFNVNEAMSGTGTLSVSGVDLTVGAATSTFTGGVALEAGSTVTTGNGEWLSKLDSLTLNADATATQFTYTGNATATYAGTLISGGTAEATVATSGAGTGALNFTGTVDGSGDLVFKALAGSTATTTLAFTSSTFTGTTVIDTMSAAVDTQASVGGAGMRILDSQVGIGANLSLDSTQSLTIGGTTTLTGAPAGTTALVVDGGLNVSGASADLTLSRLTASIGDGAASNFAGNVTLTSGSVFTVTDGADLSNASVFSDALNAGGAVTVGGDGTLAGIGSIGNAFKGVLAPGSRDNAASSTLITTGDVYLDSTSTARWYLLDSTGKSDRLDAGGIFSLNGSAAKIVYDEDFYSGSFIPASGVTVDYVMATAGTLNGTFATVDVVTVDPLTGLSTEHAVNANGATYFMGGSFEVSYANNQFMLQVIGQGGDYPLAAGTTSTNVTVDVQVGSKTVTRNANVGTVNNSQINASAAAYTALATGPSDPDEQYVATQMLLLTPGAFASAGVAISSPTNPYALPNVTMSQLFQAGDVAMKRLMQLRETPAAPAATQESTTMLLSQKGGLTDQEALSSPASSAVVTTPTSVNFGAPINGPTPDQGMRWWTRGYGFTERVQEDSWAKTSYDSATGGVMLGGDMVLGNGAIAGAYVGYMPGSVDISGGLVDETDTTNGLNFGVYGSWVPDQGAWYVEAAAQGGYAGIDRTRDIYIPGVVRTATSSNSLWAASVSSEIGINTRLGGDAFLQPHLGLSAGYVTQDGYTEDGAGSANLDVSGQTAILLQPSLGTRYMQSIRMGRDVLSPYVGAAATLNAPVGDWGVTATNAYSSIPGYSVYGSPDTIFGGSFELGVEFASYSGVTAFCQFNGMLFENQQQYGGQIGIIVPF